MQVFPGWSLYCVLAFFLLVDAAWMAIAGIGLEPTGAIFAGTVLGALAAVALILRLARAAPGKGIVVNGVAVVRAGLVDRAIVAAEAFFFLLLSWHVSRVFNHLSMAVGLPYADAVLAEWDAALGLDWNAYFAFVAQRPLLIALLGWTYTALTPVSAVALFVLLAMDRVRQAEFFVVTFFVTAAICILIGMFFPAEAAVAWLLDRPDLLSAFPQAPGVYHLEHLEALRQGRVSAFDLGDLPGLVTFPSFHTAAGVVVAWCYRRTLLFWPVLAYGLVMIASTPIFGGHYFVDVIAGAMVALIVLLLCAKLARYRSLFGRRSPVVQSVATV